MKFIKGKLYKLVSHKWVHTCEGCVLRYLGLNEEYRHFGTPVTSVSKYCKGGSCDIFQNMIDYPNTRELIEYKGDNNMTTKKELLSLFEWFINNKSKLSKEILEDIEKYDYTAPNLGEGLLAVLGDLKNKMVDGLPIKVGEDEVKFDKDNITVGCTTVSLSKLEEIVKRAKKLNIMKRSK